MDSRRLEIGHWSDESHFCPYYNDDRVQRRLNEVCNEDSVQIMIQSGFVTFYRSVIYPESRLLVVINVHLVGQNYFRLLDGQVLYFTSINILTDNTTLDSTIFQDDSCQVDRAKHVPGFFDEHVEDLLYVSFAEKYPFLN